MPGHQLIVAGHDLKGDTKLVEGAQCITDPGLRRIEEGKKAGEDQIRFVGDMRMLTIRFDVTPGHSQDAVTLCAQCLERSLRGFARRGVERNRRRSLLLITSGMTEHIFRRALDDDETPASAFDQDRNPASLEIERHFVDLAPSREVDLAGRKDSFIQRTLEPGLERGVDLRHPHHGVAVLPA